MEPISLRWIATVCSGYVRVAHPHLSADLPWDVAAERLAAWAVLALALLGLVMALLPPPG